LTSDLWTSLTTDGYICLTAILLTKIGYYLKG